MDAFNVGKLEFAISGIIQMLLVMSGIETNPGPAKPPGFGPASATDTTWYRQRS